MSQAAGGLTSSVPGGRLAVMRKPAVVALLLAACGGPPAAGFSSGPGPTSAPAPTTSSSTSTGTSSTGSGDDSAGSGSAANSSTGTLRDVGTDDDFGPVQPVGCKGKVDLLFLISRLHTMTTEQEQLLASIPDFVTTIQEKFADFDVHIMVANPDAYWPGWGCEKYGCPEYAPNCGPDALDYQCYVSPKLITACDETLGAGLTFNAGGGAANRQCELFGGNRYIVNGEPNMGDALECIAKVGWSGGIPLTGDALIAALSPQINAEGGCDAGFLRDDALLVVALISDTEDEGSKSWPYQQYDAVVTAKGGDPNAVVALAVTPQPMKDPDQTCTYNDGTAKVRDLINMFPYHAEGDTCAPSYAPFLAKAADLIGEACGSFIPG